MVGGRTRYPGIQGLRGAAALLVVLQHSIAYACMTARIDQGDYLKVGFGAWGVMLFFAISGFVIALNRDMTAGEFALRRALRIYPPFIIACLISIALMRSIGIAAELDLATALLLPVTTFNAGINIPYWTLIFEVAFYAVAAVVFAFRFSDRTLSIGCFAWIAIVMAMGGYFPTEIAAQAPRALILVSPYTQLFALGFLACLHFEGLSKQEPRALIAAAIVAIYLLNAFPIFPAGYTLLYGIACLCIVALATKVRSVPRFAYMLGDASYGIYLLHLPILVALSAALIDTRLAAHPFALWAFQAAIALAVSTLFGVIEFTLHRQLVSAFRRRFARAA